MFNAKFFSLVPRFLAVTGIIISSILLLGFSFPFHFPAMIHDATPIIVLGINAMILVAMLVNMRDSAKFTDNASVVEKMQIKTPELLDQHYADMMGKILLGVTQQLKSQIDHSNEYSSALSNADKKLRSTGRLDAIDNTIGIVLQCTSEIKDRTIAYKERLRSAESTIQNLSKRLADAERESLTDPLTGIANRRHFERMITHHIEESNQLNTPLTFALIDIDFFKGINDKYGHNVGDQILTAFARLIKKQVRPSDFIARIGGEEFAVLLPNTGLQAAETLQLRILQLLRSKNWHIVESNQNIGHITASIGLAELVENDTVESLTRRADIALYQAKTNGRDCIRRAA